MSKFYIGATYHKWRKNKQNQFKPTISRYFKQKEKVVIDKSKVIKVEPLKIPYSNF